jgi:uncharacterized protein (DUF4213/DUF364 family)
MSLKDEFRKMVSVLSAEYAIPPIARFFTPPFHEGGQPKDAQFMAMGLEDGSVGISYVLVPDEKREEYSALQASDFRGKKPEDLALDFGSEDPLEEMIGMAAINAICQHAMRVSGFEADHVTDSLGLLSISRGDRIGMVGLFSGLLRTIEEAGAELVIIERNESLIARNPHLPIHADPSRLSTCNKILSTSTTVLNDSLDEILAHCSSDAFVVVLGPTAGYFPDPLFARGVDVVGGRVVKDEKAFFKALEERGRWGDSTQKVCFQKKTYRGMI